MKAILLIFISILCISNNNFSNINEKVVFYKFFKKKLLKNSKFLYPQPIPGYYSQKGQDKYLNEQFFYKKNNGFFVEIGAHDGISFSNTYYFEKNLNWDGICIEPNPDIFQKLKINRKCYCEQIGITSQKAKKPFLLCKGYITEMYSGFMDSYDVRHLERINKEIEIYGGSKEIIYVDCISFQDLMYKYNIKKIDLLSIDVEGSEEDIIASINFNEILINIITVENNFNEDKIKNFLIKNGFEYITKIGKDDIYKNRRTD